MQIRVTENHPEISHSSVQLTYMCTRFIWKDQQGNRGSTLQIVSQNNKKLHTLFSWSTNNQELNLAKKVHRFGHGSADYIEALMHPPGCDLCKIKKARGKLIKECAIFSTSGRPKDGNQIPTTHVNTSSNEEIQANFL